MDKTKLDIDMTSQEWQEFYLKYFQMTVDFTGVIIPDDPGGFDRVIFIPQGLTFAAVIKVIYEQLQFKGEDYTNNLDNEVAENVRTPYESYAIRVRRRCNADEEWRNISANKLKQQNVNCVTLMERLVYELKFWSETNSHLDDNYWTLCAGSRDSYGYVPKVHWFLDGRGVDIGLQNPNEAYVYLCARQAVSKTIQEKLVPVHIINCDADPFLPDGWRLEVHKKGGQFCWDPAKIKLYRPLEQVNLILPEQKGIIVGYNLREKLDRQNALNACVLDYLLAHPELIPYEWNHKNVYFWGTIYCHSPCNYSVRCLRWVYNRKVIGLGDWHGSYRSLGEGFFDPDPAAVLVNT